MLKLFMKKCRHHTGTDIEWPNATNRDAKRRAGKGSEDGVSAPQDWSPGALPPGFDFFLNFRRNLVQSGAFFCDKMTSVNMHQT